MASTAERGTEQSQGKIDGIFHVPMMSRRKFLAEASGLFLSAAVIAEACSVPGASSATTKPNSSPSASPFSSPEASGIVAAATPESTPSLPDLTGDTFIKSFSKLDGKTSITIPQEGNTSITKTTDELAAYASGAWGENITSRTITRNPMHALEFALAAAENTGIDGTVDMSSIFPELSLSLPRFSINTLPNNKEIETTINISPQNLTLRKGINMTVLGVNGDNAVVAFSDTVRKSKKNPTMYFGILPLEVQGQQQDGIVSLQDILSLNGATYDSASQSILYTDTGKTLALHSLESQFDTNIVNRAGSYFIDLDPLKKNKDGSPAMEANPIISVLPSQFASDKIVQLKDGRVGAQDANGKLVARARFFFNEGRFNWATDKESLQDFTIRELADANNLNVSVFTFGGEFSDPIYNSTIETVANKVIIAAELDSINVFQNFTNADWKRVLSDWSTISTSFDKGVVPDGFNYNWRGANDVIAFAKRHDMSVAAQHLLGNSDIPDLILNGNFSNAELTKILEFMTKTKVVQYKGVINDWEGAAEVSAMLLWGNDQQKFWFNKFGTGIIDKVFIWAHEANPDAKLRFTEDHILDNIPELRNMYLGFLQHFKQANIPVDIASIENNMWIYNAPSEQTMLSILKQIKAMGYQIVSGETTVVTSDISPFDPTTLKTVHVTNVEQAQANVYRSIADATLSVGGEFGLGGFTDAYEWYEENNPGPSKNRANAMIFDKDFQPKPAYFAILDVFKNHYKT